MATKADLFLEIISPLLLHSKAGLGEEQTSIDLNWNRLLEFHASASSTLISRSPDLCQKRA